RHRRGRRLSYRTGTAATWSPGWRQAPRRGGTGGGGGWGGRGGGHRVWAWPVRDRPSSPRRTNLPRLEGKVAVVTGGNSGIGLATAKRLQEEGARLASSGRSKTTLDEAGKTIGIGVLAVQADVATLAAVDKLYAEVSTKVETMDVLFV